MFQTNIFESYFHLLSMRDFEEFEIAFGLETMEPDPFANDVQDLNEDNGDNNKQAEEALPSSY